MANHIVTEHVSDVKDFVERQVRAQCGSGCLSALAQQDAAAFQIAGVQCCRMTFAVGLSRQWCCFLTSWSDQISGVGACCMNARSLIHLYTNASGGLELV